ncbi:MAG: isoleucine--tRNA ligase [Deltaproteobacteria bacterium CG11_big_fil_rev_8_21_14_0_20_45_16]|nr:MAG: isoleucine--tRNA ligase [Deltaproteobacteria bacterium CG11_big_fil_rev_8_21_14_0_20_45_16]
MSEQAEITQNQNSNQISFPKMEEEILARWAKQNIFQKSLDSKKKAYSFYDGPPFATGLPHYGHLLASTLKDIVPRYWTMRGFRVERRWGWDCHGLPIEQEIDKKHQFKSTNEIEAFGIARYNEECRSIVLRFTEEWERVITRLGRWADFKNDYKTMDRDFMESVWWVFKQIWDKGLIYRGYKVMAFSTALGTPLSNFEAGSNYQEVQDPAITISFPLVDDPNVSFLAWTTTPWTLPSNLSLLVGKDISYSKIKTKDGKQFILAEALLSKFFKEGDYQIEENTLGLNLVGTAYVPLFDFFKSLPAPHFTVQLSDHVSTEDGTGIVHSAPAHGEEDYASGKLLGLKLICPVDPHGLFTDEVPTYKDLYVKDADKLIIQDLKKSGRLFKQETINHRYAFCPRTDTPLISRAVASWFVSVEKIKDKLCEINASQTHWVPEHLRDGRFGKWLENARDWAISRNRYWGNPLPIWEAFEEPVQNRESFCLGSLEELQKFTGEQFKDIHREHLDDIIIEKNGKKFKRVPEVLDCWFESGSMPYAQYHYPFENKKQFEAEFPADFIGEGLDQTRGWFYTLSVLGTILFEKIPFKNVVVNGLILAEDGKKMSKRLKNYPDPMDVMHSYGADALRLYLIDSPVIRAEELRFSEKGVKEIVRKVQLKLWNAYSFFESYAEIDGYKKSMWTKPPQSKNILDRWIISRMQSLLKRIETEMTLYHLYSVVPEVLKFLEELTNTYIRLNRSRFWDEGFTEDKKSAFDTLHYVMTDFSKVMAPFMPFLSDKLYLLLSNETGKESVHLDDYPRSQETLINPSLEQGVALLEEVILLSRNLREKEKIKVRIPLKELVIVHRKASALESLRPLESYLKSELNIRNISYTSDEPKYVEVSIKANGATLGPRAGKRMGELMKAISTLSFEDLQKLDEGERLKVAGDVEISAEDVRITRKPVDGSHSVSASSKIAVALDLSVDRDQELEGNAREIINRIQNFRKDTGLNLADRIHLEIQAPKELLESLNKHRTFIMEQTLALEIKEVSSCQYPRTGNFEIDGQSITLALKKA